MKKSTFIGLCACALFATMSNSAIAANAQADDTTAAGTVDSLALVDAKVSKLQQVLDKLPNVSGFMQLLYTFEDTTPNVSQFRVRRARITLAGKIYKNLADYNFMAEFAGTPKLLDAFVRITPWKQFNFQAGSFRPSFTIENFYYGATSMELIDYPKVVNKLTTLSEMTGIASGSAGRDLGMQVYGGFLNQNGFSMIQYYAGIYNGNGVEYSNINSHRDFAAMLRVNPIKDLAFVGSVYVGKWAPAGAGTYADRNRWSGGFMYDNKKWFMRGEYVGGVTGNASAISDTKKWNGADSSVVVTDDNRLHTDGAYLTAGVWFCNHKVAPVARVDFYTWNTKRRSSSTDINYTVGVDYRPWKYLRFQVNYTAETYSYNQKNDTNGRSMNNLVMVMLTGMF